MLPYMFVSPPPLWVRFISLYHVSNLIMLLYCIKKLGYHPRAIIYQTLLTWPIFIICYYFTEPSKNINFVFGLVTPVQATMPPSAYFLLCLLVCPLLFYLPAHLICKKFWTYTTPTFRQDSQ